MSETRHSVIYHDDYDSAAYAETLKMSSRLSGTVQDASARLPIAGDLIEDLFYSFYRPSPQLVDEGELSPSAQVARAILAEIMATTQWESVRKAGTVSDQLYSAIATATVAQSVVNTFDEKVLLKLQELREAEEEAEKMFSQAETLEDLAQQAKGDKAQALYEQAKAARETAEREQEQAQELAEELAEQAEEIEDNSRQAARAALESAEEDIEATEAAINTFTNGYSTGGKGSGSGGSGTMPLKEKMSLAAKVGKSERLKQIAELTGRMTRIALQCQKSKIKHPPDEIVGVATGRDLGKTLPVELAQLSDPELEIFFFKKYTESQLMQLDMVGSEKQGRGPLVVALDSSGSMGDLLGGKASKEAWSKAVTLALLAIARKQKRDFAVIHFSHGQQMKVYEFPRGEATPNDLIACTDYFIKGGTEYHYWMQKALSLVEMSRYDRADVICVSDGEVSIPHDLETDWNRRRTAKGMRCYSVMLGNDRQGASVLGRISDAIATIGDLSADNAALNMMFSV
jgi:uncharacterized protein with von Willebrand factor type A (vWA) domain